MSVFLKTYTEWLKKHAANEKNPRRRERLEKGLSHSTVEFLRTGWYAAVGNLDHLYPEWEVRDIHNAVRYLDLAYIPPGVKGCIEIQDFRSHARDIGVSRFKDLCKKHSMLALDDWIILHVAYPSIKDEPEFCRQLVLAFIGKFLSTPVSSGLDWAEADGPLLPPGGAVIFSGRTGRSSSPFRASHQTHPVWTGRTRYVGGGQRETAIPDLPVARPRAQLALAVMAIAQRSSTLALPMDMTTAI